MTDRVPRLLDPDALDRKRDPRARASIVVPPSWLREGARLEVALPGKLRCDLCDGGGCDGCARSGAYRVEGGAKVALTLPRVTDDIISLRVTNPFGDAPPTMLVVRVAAGVEASSGVTWLGPNHDVPPKIGPVQLPRMPRLPRWASWAAIVILAVVAAWIAHCVTPAR